MKFTKITAAVMACALMGAAMPAVTAADMSFTAVYAAESTNAADDFLASAFDVKGGSVSKYEVGKDPIELKGRAYYSGILFNTTSYSSDMTSEASFNVEDVKSFECTFSHMDDGRTGKAEVSVYLDDVLVDKFSMTSTTPLYECSVDTSDAAVMRIVMTRAGGAAYAMVDLRVDGVSSAKNYTVPTYKKSELFLEDSFNRSGVNMVNAVGDSDTFRLKGRKFYNGALFNTTNYSSDVTSRIDFNVENIKEFSCIFSHIDNGRTGTAEVDVYLDDVLVDKISLNSTALIYDYSLDVSDAAMMRISVARTGGAAYAMADVTIDGISPAKKPVVPQYKKPEAFIEDAFNCYELNKVNAVSDFDTFRMRGRKYYSGVLFNTTSYSSDMVSRMDLNVENLKTFSCTFGHLDNKKTGNSEISVYLDDVLVDKFSIDSCTPLYDYSVDVSEASVMRFRIERKSGANCGMANISIDEIAPAKAYVVPGYEKPEELIADAFNCEGLSTKDAVSEYEAFRINGRRYYTGVLFNTTSYAADMTSRIDFNVENIDHFDCVFGHLDDQKFGDMEVSVYLDNVLSDKFAMSSNSPIRPFSIDVADAATMRFYISRKSGGCYAMTDIAIDGHAPAKDCVIPQYETAKEFLAAAYNTSDMKVVDAVSDYDTFDMNGRTYRQGIVMDTASYAATMNSSMTFNVENLKEISFDAAHIDNGKTGDGSFTIYYDNVKGETFELTSEMMTKRHTINVAKANNILISVTRNSGAAYGFGNFEIVEYTGEDELLMGDVNMDGQVNAADASAVLVEYSILSTGGASGFTDDQTKAADVDLDGQVNASDASVILRYYAYLSTGGTEKDILEWIKNN